MIYEWMGKKMLLNEMELDIDQIAENLNAFEKFLDTLPEKAFGLWCQSTICGNLIFSGFQTD